MIRYLVHSFHAPALAVNEDGTMVDGTSRNVNNLEPLYVGKTMKDAEKWRKDNTPIKHSVSRQSDEYSCSCGARWDYSEGSEHP